MNGVIFIASTSGTMYWKNRIWYNDALKKR